MPRSSAARCLPGRCRHRLGSTTFDPLLACRPGQLAVASAGFGLQSSCEKQDDKNDQDDTENSDAAVTIAVAVAAEAAAETTEQENDEDNDEDESERHDLSPFPASKRTLIHLVVRP